MTRIFFTTDVHGSEVCFRKFLNAGKFYKADVLILGGDITGKMMIPLIKQDGIFNARLMGSDEIACTEEELQALEARVRNSGYYPFQTTPDEVDQLRQDKNKADEVLHRLMRQVIVSWLQLAEERLKPLGIPCYISPGNDDPFAIDVAFEGSKWVIVPEGKVIQLDKDLEMISTGFASMTPWACPRDIEEEKLAGIIESMALQVNKMENCIFNFHCPPYDTLIDGAPLLDKDLRLVASVGGSEMVPVGSKSVRAAIEKYQPLLGLHGHIHEARGRDKLGRTLVLNPGSEYGEGILRGVLVEVNKGKLKNFNFTSG
jgi:Icc-related predicted phosphoesterase